MTIHSQYFRGDTNQVQEVLDNYGVRFQEIREVIKAQNGNESSDLLSAFVYPKDKSLEKQIVQDLNFVPGTVAAIV